METVTITEMGCYLDNHRGHYIQRDVVLLAKGYGFIIGQFEQFALDMYDEHNHGTVYPHEGLTELTDEAVNWLNSGQSECDNCEFGSYPKDGEFWTHKDDEAKVPRCKKCSGTGRGDRMAGQNFPPILPPGTNWAWNDGDFGVYYVETDGECPICGADGEHLSAEERADIEFKTGEPWWVQNCTH